MATQLNDNERSRKPVKMNKKRSPGSLVESCSKPNDNRPSTSYPYRRSSSLSLSAEFSKDTLEAALKQSLLNTDYSPSSTKSNIVPSPSQMTKSQLQENGLSDMKAQHNGDGISWRWSRIRKGVRTKRLICPTRRRSTDSTNTQSALKDKHLQRQVLLSEEDTLDDIVPVIQNVNTGFSSDHLTGQNGHSKNKNSRTQEKDRCRSSASLSSKYQPKFFEDIAGHEIIVKALSNAVQKEKVAPLYLLHGPSGTGKTSTARIFSMALNCESTTDTKPCWCCRGCTRSLYIMDLCSGSRISGFERIRTLLQSTTFTQIVSGFKVFIIEECHSLTAEAWEEILNIAERGYGSTVVFVMITEDVNMVPKSISSRCQKFCLPKLKDMDITLKLARIVAREEIEIDRDALRLITSKADGSMREAENILDQLALLSSRITSPMVQQIVGLVPHNKLLDLLMTVLSADTIKIVRATRELIASGVQPQSILSQLASLVTDILSGASATGLTSPASSSKEKRLSRTGSQLSDDQSERLSHALTMLVETGKQLSSSNDQTNWVVAALLKIASGHVSNKNPSGIVLPRDVILPSDIKHATESRHNSVHLPRNGISEVLPHSRSRRCQLAIDSILEGPDINTNDLNSLVKSISKANRVLSKTDERESNLGQIGNMEEVWKNVLERIQIEYVREFLCQQAKIASLTISSANAIIHLMFKRPEDKLAAQMSEETIENALKTAFSCPVTINMSLEPIHMEINERITVSTPKGKEAEIGYFKHQQGSMPFLPMYESPHSQNAGVAIRHNGSRKSSAAASDGSRTKKLQGEIHISQGQDTRPLEKQDASTTRPQQILPFSGPLTQRKETASEEPENDQLSAGEQNPSTITNIKKATKTKHRWLSLSSIQQGDASVERYSQDLLFENETKDRERGRNKHSKLFKGSIKDNEEQDNNQNTTVKTLNRSWSCSEVFCRRDIK